MAIQQQLPFPGAVDQGDGAVTFTLYAPGKEAVSVVGDFNDWQPGKTPLAPHDGLWTTQVQLDAGTHRYYFVVDEKAISDPYARRIERAEDADAPPFALVDIGAEPFAWRYDNFNRPRFEDLILYEVLPHDFSESKDFAGIQSRLGYIRDLGITGIQIMPVFGCAPDDEWGYAPEFFFAPRPEYGTPDDLRRLIDAIHQHDMAVLIDIVPAHSGGDHPYHQIYGDDESPWYGEGIGGVNEFGLPTFDHRKPPAQDFWRDVLQFWLREYHIDGYRLDYMKLVDEENGLGAPKLIRDIREARADAYIISEMLPEVPEKLNRWDTNGAWHLSIGRALRRLFMEDLPDAEQKEGDPWEEFINALDPAGAGWSDGNKRINYIESHDEERLVRELKDNGLDGTGARWRSSAAAAILITMPGEPMIYQGQEWGEKSPLNEDGSPLEWPLLGEEGGRGIHTFYRRLIRLRHDHPALCSNNFSIESDDAARRCVVYKRWNDSGDQVITCVNLSADPQTVAVQLPEIGRWDEVVAESELDAEGGIDVQLEPYSARIFVRPSA